MVLPLVSKVQAFWNLWTNRSSICKPTNDNALNCKINFITLGKNDYSNALATMIESARPPSCLILPTGRKEVSFLPVPVYHGIRTPLWTDGHMTENITFSGTAYVVGKKIKFVQFSLDTCTTELCFCIAFVFLFQKGTINATSPFLWQRHLVERTRFSKNRLTILLKVEGCYGNSRH